MAYKWEDYDPVGKYQTAWTTDKNMVVGGTLAVTGATTLSSTLAVTGAATFSGAITQKANVVSGSGATVTLTAAQSGSTVLMDRAAGIVFTLPAPAAGMYFDFLVTTSVTSNSYKVITDAGTTLLAGSLISIDTDSSNETDGFVGNGSTHIAVTMAAASSNATGGLIGTWLRFTCVSSTLWLVEGIVQGGGTVSTPFATS